MNDYWYMVVAFLAGIILGLFYYGTLWLTVRRVTHLRRPTMALAISLVLRAAIVVAVLYGLMRGDWYNLVAALIGFIAGRFVVDARVKRSPRISYVERNKERSEQWK
jgi:F1F0 ATPase subunit 2